MDTGAQFSLINANITHSLGIKGKKCNKAISTLNLNENKTGFLCNSKLMLPSSDFVDVKFFAVPGLNLTMNVKGITNNINELRNKNFELSSNIPSYCNDQVNICGVIGNDILSKFSVFEYCSINKNKFVRLANGFIPVGPICKLKNIDVNCDIGRVKEGRIANELKNNTVSSTNKFNVLNDECKKVKFYKNSKVNKNSKAKGKNKPVKNNFKLNKKLQNIVNSVLEPKQEYFSPLNEIFVNSDVEQGLEQLYSLESIGIKNENTSTYHENEIKKFENSIELKDGHYYVDLPWHMDILEKVPSNYSISKVIAKQVYYSNTKKKLNDEYLKVFDTQKELGIIEEIPFPYKADNHVWIPHHAVVRNDPLGSHY